MKIYLRDINRELVDAWKEQPWEDDVEISQGDIFAGPVADAIVSAAQSFGYMDGGLDAIYSFRWPFLQEDLQRYLARWHDGELPVGNAVIIPIEAHGRKQNLPGKWAAKEGGADFKYLISAPTMRIPMVVAGTVNAYLAFRAALIAIKNYDAGKINSILCPGLGTAIGKLPYKAAAYQMYRAYQNILKKPFDIGEDLTDAWNDHDAMREGSPSKWPIKKSGYGFKVELED